MTMHKFTFIVTIETETIRHPIWVHEASTMNLEAWRLESPRAQQDDKTIDIEDVELIAADLMSEHGENLEYDRALVELVATVRGLSPADNRKSIEARLRAIGFPQNRSMVWGL